MKTTTARKRIPTRSADAPRAAAPGAWRRWARFVAGLVVILLFAFGVIPGLQRLGPVRQLRDAIRNRDIDASALFYTDSELSCEAEASIRNAIRHSAHRAEARDSLEATGPSGHIASDSSLRSQ